MCVHICVVSQDSFLFHIFTSVGRGFRLANGTGSSPWASISLVPYRARLAAPRLGQRRGHPLPGHHRDSGRNTLCMPPSFLYCWLILECVCLCLNHLFLPLFFRMGRQKQARLLLRILCMQNFSPKPMMLCASSVKSVWLVACLCCIPLSHGTCRRMHINIYVCVRVWLKKLAESMIEIFWSIAWIPVLHRFTLCFHPYSLHILCFVTFLYSFPMCTCFAPTFFCSLQVCWVHRKYCQ